MPSSSPEAPIRAGDLVLASTSVSFSDGTQMVRGEPCLVLALERTRGTTLSVTLLRPSGDLVTFMALFEEDLRFMLTRPVGGVLLSGEKQ
jgi:hypothetical protein